MVGITIEDKYRIVRILGEGGMGRVYEAIEQRSGRRVAIKTLRPEHTSDGEMLARFRAEADVLRRVSHQGLAEIYDEGALPSGELFIVMEFLRGQTLRQLLSGGKLELERALAIVAQMAAALSAVHSSDIVHRDLKPENIMLLGAPTDLPRVKILDFGIAKLCTVTTDRTQIKTRMGVLIGTPAYMAPEQCGGPGEIGDRTDVYAVGIVLYEMLARRPPFVGETDQQILGKQLFHAPTALRLANPEVPADVELLVHAMLAKPPERRPSMEAVSAAVATLFRGERLSASQTTALNLARDSATVYYESDRTTRQRVFLRERWFVASLGGLILALSLVGTLWLGKLRSTDAGPPGPTLGPKESASSALAQAKQPSPTAATATTTTAPPPAQPTANNKKPFKNRTPKPLATPDEKPLTNEQIQPF